MESIKQQFVAAATGVQDAVGRIWTENGIKDATAAHWQDQMIQCARMLQAERISNMLTCDSRLVKAKTKSKRLKDPELAKAVKQQIKDKIQSEVLEWVFTQPPEEYSWLPVNSRKLSLTVLIDHFQC